MIMNNWHVLMLFLSISLFLLYQLEEHMTYLVCEVEFNKNKYVTGTKAVSHGVITEITKCNRW